MILGLLCRLGGSRGGSNGITDGETSTDGVFMGFTGKKWEFTLWYFDIATEAISMFKSPFY